MGRLLGRQRTDSMIIESVNLPDFNSQVRSVANDRNGPAIVDARTVASCLGHSLSWFYNHRDNLEAHGFPTRDPLLSGWHVAAICKWLARRAGLDEPQESSDKTALRRAIGARKNALRNAA
jgi:predicted DNA-binding transcriptional regulator AlpA